nr:MAG TPA: hypothetical protein [Caudoviricetes sp.]
MRQIHRYLSFRNTDGSLKGFLKTSLLCDDASQTGQVFC